MSLVTTFKQITLVDCYLSKINGRSWPTARSSSTARLAYEFTAPFLLAQSLRLTGPLFSKLLDGVQIHNPVACGSAPPL